MKRFKINPHNQTQKSGGRTMKKKVLSVVMAAAMMTSVFSTTDVTASAADAEELVDYADASILVVRQHTALVKDINEAISILNSGEGTMLGCVYNDVFHGIAQTARNYGYRYAYGSGSSYGYGYGYGNKYGYGYGYGYGRSSRQSKQEEQKEQHNKDSVTERQVKKEDE